MAIIGVLGMVAIVVSWIMIAIGFFKKGSNLKSKGFKILGVGCILFFGALLLDDKPPKTDQPSTSSKQEAKVETKSPAKQEAKSVEVKKDDVKEKITQICKDTMGSKFINVEINENFSDEPGAKGTKIVLVTGKLHENFTDEMTRQGNIMEAQKVFKSLYTSGQPIGNVVYFSQAEFVDNYGKKSTGNAFKFAMSKKTADKIDWNNINAVGFDNFASILDEAWMLPQFRKKAK